MKIVALLVLALATMQGPEAFDLRGQIQTLHLDGPATGEPVIVSSGDGGWVHLAPHIASVLAGRGFFVVGFDAKAYLASFTSKRRSLDAAMEASDYAALAGFGARATGKKPILIGVSEGGGLSVPLAAIHSAADEFVALRDIQRIVANANEPKRLSIVKASDHGFSDNRDEFDARLFEAIDWVKQHAPK